MWYSPFTILFYVETLSDVEIEYLSRSFSINFLQPIMDGLANNEILSCNQLNNGSFFHVIYGLLVIWGIILTIKRRKTFFLLVSFFAQEESTTSIRDKYSSSLAVVLIIDFSVSYLIITTFLVLFHLPLPKNQQQCIYCQCSGKEAIKLQLSPEYITPFSGAIPSCSKKLLGSLSVLTCNKKSQWNKCQKPNYLIYTVKLSRIESL